VAVFNTCQITCDVSPYRRIGNRGFATPVNKCIRNPEIAKCDFPIRKIVCGSPRKIRAVHLEGRVAKDRAPSGYRRSQAQRFCAFRNRDPRNPDKLGTTVSTAAKEDRGVVEASC
jgi:hypothetical protein